MWLKPRGLDKLLSMAPPPSLTIAFVEKCLAHRTKMEEHQGEKGGGRRDFFHYLYHAVDPETGERGYPLGGLYGECESLIIAGGDTTPIVTSALFYLARRPAVQSKLARELRSTFSRSSEISAGAALQSCKYLRTVIQEALRMAPPVSA